MKSIKKILAGILAASMMAMPVLAAEFVPSAERNDSVNLISYILNEFNTPCCSVHIISIGNIHLDDIIDEEKLDIEYDISEEMEEQIRESLRKASAELQNGVLHELITGFKDAWEKLTGGAPLENAVIHDLFEIVLICSEADAFKTDESVTVSFTVDGIDADDLFLIAHKPTGSDEWILEDYTIDENGVITMTVDKLSPFAIIKDSGKAPEAAGTSPQTGVQDYTVFAGAAAVALCGIGALCAGKKRRFSNR
ncbi:MAG: hypothetical protein J6N32_06170 [Clostridia bacterium]|nr:hypothetical protein [Clostridia bacterium]MBP3293319.1 hypothetical protein [Clostridia bacterium]